MVGIESHRVFRLGFNDFDHRDAKPCVTVFRAKRHATTRVRLYLVNLVGQFNRHTFASLSNSI